MSIRNHLFRVYNPNLDGLIGKLKEAKRGNTASLDLNNDKKGYAFSCFYTHTDEWKAKIDHFLAQADGLTRFRNQPTAMLFTGQGSTSPKMFSQLPTPLLDGPCLSMTEEFLTMGIDCTPWIGHPDPSSTEINQTLYSQPCLFIFEVMLGKLWQDAQGFGKTLIGHSIGEIAAHHLAGHINLKDSIKLISLRAQMMQNTAEEGGLIAVQASAIECEQALKTIWSQIDTAAINSDKQTVLACDLGKIKRVQYALKAAGLKHVILKVNKAFHSRWMANASHKLSSEQQIMDLEYHQQYKFQVLSNISAEPISKLEYTYWGQHIQSTVIFKTSIENAWNRGCRVFVELGPKMVLSQLTKNILANKSEPKLIIRGYEHKNQFGYMEGLCAFDSYVSPVAWDKLIARGL